MPTAPNKTVLDTILDWSTDRPLWQRDALRRIVSKGHLEASDISELVSLCKVGKGAPAAGVQPVPLEKAHLPATPGQGEAVSLLSISDVQGVNSLAASQVVEFEPTGITIIYGDNGAGKSGYGRILKRACRARHSGKIEPNVYSSEVTPPQAKATFTYMVGDKAQQPEKWEDASTPHSILSAISVFDRDCSAVHIRAKNEVAFRPFGLDIPDELADACQRVKDTLATEQKKAENERHPIFLKPTWKDQTTVGKALAGLSHTTKFESIQALGTLSDEESARLQQLREDLSKDPKKAAGEQTLKADNIQRLSKTLTSVSEKTSDSALTTLWKASQDARAKPSQHMALCRR